ncbi:hypothetical protein [Deinococcus yunweiensis]|uniref:hypothetical protein n=1 Tax=Deinococcus yunweiensis TaxID=367282 RepID=UPI00398EE523
MQKAPHILVLMVALAAGAASAEGTLAGTTITNTASAEYPDPTNTASTVSTPSNTVSTVVLPKPGFDVAFTAGTTDGGTQNALGTTTVVTTGAVPGQQISTPYSLVNNGNVALTINLSADQTGSDPGATVKYYLANPDGSRGAEITTGTVTVNPERLDDPLTIGVDEAFDGIVKIIQVVTLPTDPAQIDSTKVFGASPVGTVTGTQGADPLTTPGNGYASGATATEEDKPASTDLQFTRVTVYAPVLDNNPNGTVTTPVDSAGNPITNLAVIPTVAPVLVPTQTVGTPGDATPVISTPGYTNPTAVTGDPTPGGTPIAQVSADEQVAYPKADTNATPDTVVFTNVLTNSGGQADKVQLFPALADGTPDPAYTYNPATGEFVNATTGVTVRFLDPVTGAVILASTDPTNPTVAQYPTLTVPNGSTAVYRTEVTYPDSDDSAAVPQYSIPVGADSLSDADTVSNNTATNTILPPATQFGDTTAAQGADAPQAPVQVVNPSGAASDGSSAVTTDNTAVFPVDAVNNGQYNDSYTLSGSATFTDAVTGATTTVPVLYYATDGVTLLPRLSSDPLSPDYNKFITPVMAPGTEYKAVAVVQTPAGTGTGDYTVSQTAVSNYSSTIVSDTNDIVRVSPTGSVAVAKFAAKAGVAAGSDPMNGINNPAGYTATGQNGAKPLETISYRIIAKNNYNTPVPLFVRDTVPDNTTFASVAITPLPTKTIYRVGGNTGTWSATVPAANLPAGTIIDVAPDADNNNLPDNLAPGATLSVDFVVTVK